MILNTEVLSSQNIFMPSFAAYKLQTWKGLVFAIGVIYFYDIGIDK